MKRPMPLLVFLVAGVFLGSGASLIYLKSRTKSPPAAPIVQQPESDALSGLTIPPFSLIDHHGEPFTHENLKGRVTVLDFFFIHCPTICPIKTAKLAALTETLADTGVRFVSVSVDPKHDRPEQLRAYAKMHEADLIRWSFLTGDEQTVTSIVADGLKFVMEQDKTTSVTLESGEVIHNILHPSWFVLLGPDGGQSGIKGLYRSSSDEDIRRLANDARALDRQLRSQTSRP
ncbi:MAG: SCO family protein [Phycisphaerales bacterium]